MDIFWTITAGYEYLHRSIEEKNDRSVFKIFSKFTPANVGYKSDVWKYFDKVH